MTEEDDIGININELTQPQTRYRTHKSIARFCVGTIISGVVLPNGSDIAAHSNSVVEADRGDDQGTRTQKVGVLPCRLSQNLRTQNKRIIGACFAIKTHAFNGRCVNKVSLDIADSRVKQVSDGVTQIFLCQGVRCIQRIVGTTPVVSGDSELSILRMDESFGVRLKERCPFSGNEGCNPQTGSHTEIGNVASTGSKIVSKLRIRTPIAYI